jgi:hypothetical protein
MAKWRSMPQRRSTVGRLRAFSDGVFAVLITIMVLELKPPEQPTFAAFLPLWPTALSYAVSYYLRPEPPGDRGDGADNEEKRRKDAVIGLG